MKGMPHSMGSRAVRARQAVFCVLLAFFLLYNPFIALYASHSANSVHTPQRHRATVGSSELQHYSPVQDETQPIDLSVEEERDEVAAPAGSYVAQGFEHEELVPQPELMSRVWSRPPPSL